MPFELFTDVILAEDLPAANLRAGDVATVVDCQVALKGDLSE
ncbi:MAG: hypothetical protein ACP5I8_08505 [Phycisphaerae bacterium]